MMKAWLRSPWAPLALTIAWLAVTSWARPLTLPDEGRYVGVAWSMLTGGDWLVPHLNGLPYFHKPPLFYWLTATALSVLGANEWAARFASLAGAAGGATALYLFARRWMGERQARLALLALATQPLFYLGAQFANLDMLVAGCIGATILAFAHAALLQAEGQPARAALAAGYVLAALGVLAKGLIGVVLPGLVLLAWLLAQRRPRAVLGLLWLPGVALFLALAAPWFILMQLRFPEFAHYFFVVQHFSRFAQGGFNNVQPAWFFPVVLAVLALPWSAWLLRARGRDPLHLLLWIWLAAIVLFFSLPQSKLVGYVLPATLPLALLAASAMATASRGWRACALGAAATCVVAAGVAATHSQGSARELGAALRARALPGERVLLLEGSYFDLAFYGRLPLPPVVVDAWDDPALTSRDNWRKELVDAGRFDPQAAARLLVLPDRACSAAATWVVGNAKLTARYPWLRAAQRVANQGDTVLWRLATTNGCQGVPSQNPVGTS
ncbi:glycosyltransferase family 39 protein [Ramlibacter sp. XY19]|uniref:ArnT family glycosyltransferase n=1 Tax=Ramlibacter paludis TaxID=2908000 RepID=UPI0023DA5A60|nr:glycosyltransferase family 39 protein [Ramlibacter paludis]MCG2594499.1 glycosyltransferase family 39 protein [Ramlibacter paludis]